MSLDKKVFTVALAQYIFFNFHLPLFPPEVANKKVENFQLFTELSVPLFFSTNQITRFYFHFLIRACLFVFQYKIYSCFFVCLHSKNLSVNQKVSYFTGKLSCSRTFFTKCKSALIQTILGTSKNLNFEY